MVEVNESDIKDAIDPISIESTGIILEQMKSSVCKIHLGKINGTGFFTKIPYKNQFLPVLITNHHVLGENDILPGKIITGWKLINRHDNTNGGTWDRNGKVLGTNNYDFTFTSCFWRGLHWTLKLYGFKIPEDYDENKDLDESDYY